MGGKKNIQPIPLTNTALKKRGVLIFIPKKNPWKSASETTLRIIDPPTSLAEAFGARSTVSGGGDFEGRPSSQWQCRSGTFRCRESRGGVVVVETRGFW